MSCLLYFVFFFASFSDFFSFSSSFFSFDTSNRLNAYLSLLIFCVFLRSLGISLYLIFTGPMYTFYMEKLARIWNNFCVIEHIFLFIPISPWICHINSPHMPDTWLHLLMSDDGNVHTAHTYPHIHKHTGIYSVHKINVKAKLFPHIFFPATFFFFIYIFCCCLLPSPRNRSFGKLKKLPIKSNQSLKS